MQNSEEPRKHRYRLVFSGVDPGGVTEVEFEALSAYSALKMAASEAHGRDLELYEDGESLGHMKYDERAGFWEIDPPAEG